MKVSWNLGLGDAIACAAIVAKLATENKLVEIPCWKHNEVSVKSFFFNYPNVKVLPINQLDDIGWGISSNIQLGYYNKEMPQLPHEDFVQWFYRQAGMKIQDKKNYCPLAETAEVLPPLETPLSNFIFIHADSDRGFDVRKEYLSTKNNVMYNINTQCSILQYQSILFYAKEIHCIDSSFLHLVECLPTTGKLFYHKYARPDSPDYKYLKKEWQVLT